MVQECTKRLFPPLMASRIKYEQNIQPQAVEIELFLMENYIFSSEYTTRRQFSSSEVACHYSSVCSLSRTALKWGRLESLNILLLSVPSLQLQHFFKTLVGKTSIGTSLGTYYVGRHSNSHLPPKGNKILLAHCGIFEKLESRSVSPSEFKRLK